MCSDACKSLYASRIVLQKLTKYTTQVHSDWLLKLGIAFAIYRRAKQWSPRARFCPFIRKQNNLGGEINTCVVHNKTNIP